MSHAPTRLLLALVLTACVADSDVGGDDASERTDDANLHDANLGDATAVDATVVDAAPTTTPDAGGFSDWVPPAKGIWIWRWDYIGMSAAEVAEICADAGIGYVLIKSGQDERFWSDRYNADTVGEFTSRGMRVLAWPYITPNDIPGAIDAAIEAANVPGTSGLVLDVETEFKGHAEEARQLCEGIRAGAPDTWLAYTSFGWVGYHPSFPFETFDTYCGDGFFPQVYWSNRGVAWDDYRSYDQAMEMLDESGLTAPIWTVQSNDSFPEGGAPTTEDLNAFFEVAGAYASLWEFPLSGHGAKVDQLADLHWANTADSKRRTAVVRRRLRATVASAVPELPAGPSAERTVATQLSLLAAGDEQAFRNTFVPALRPSIDHEVFESCAIRVKQSPVLPDWAKAVDRVIDEHVVRDVSMFGKSTTGFHELDGEWLADRAWCAPVVPLAPTDPNGPRGTSSHQRRRVRD